MVHSMNLFILEIHVVICQSDLEKPIDNCSSKDIYDYDLCKRSEVV